MSEKVLTLDGAAKYLKLSVEVTQGLLESGELAGKQIAGEWRTTSRAALNCIDGGAGSMTCCTTADGETVCCPPGSTGCC